MLCIFTPRFKIESCKLQNCKLKRFVAESRGLFYFCSKLVDVAHITTTNQLVSQQDDIASNNLFVLANQKLEFTQLQLNFAARQVCMQAEKSAASVFCSNVARQIGEFVAHITVPLGIARVVTLCPTTLILSNPISAASYYMFSCNTI